MPDTQVFHRSPNTPSNKPIYPSRIPSNNTLIPPARRITESKTSPPPQGIPTSPSSSFRSLRSLLPFGPGKLPTPVSSNVATSRSPFASFTSVRRSITGERKNSTSKEPNTSPIISIDRPSPDTPVLIRKSVSYPRLEDSKLLPNVSVDPPYDSRNEDDLVRRHSGSGLPEGSRSSPSSLTRPAVKDTSRRSTSPGAVIGAELSTIIEADTSGISKHLPDSDGSFLSEAPDTSKRSTSNSPDPHDTSALDLSTSNLKAEVMDAMLIKDYAAAADWLNGSNPIVVDDDDEMEDAGDDDDDDEVTETLADKAADRNFSFNFGALDPDLAALLSPNKIVDKTTTAAPPPRTPSQSRENVMVQPAFTPSPTRSETSPPNSRVLGNQSTPMRRSLSIPRPQIPPVSSLPRLRSNLLHTTPARPTPNTSPEIGHDSARRGSSDSVRRRGQAPPSPLSGTRQFDPPDSRRLPSPRIITSHHGSPSSLESPSQTRSSLRPSPPGRWDTHSTSLSPRTSPSSRLSASTDNRRPSLDGDPRTDLADRNMSFILRRSRKRSMSVDEHRGSPGSVSNYSRNMTPPMETRPSSSMSSARPSVEWMGPRTAKVFAAAGLLDLDRDRDRDGTRSNGSSSRFGSVRSERDFRSHHPPSSRMGFSESGSNSSWGGGRRPSEGTPQTMAVSDRLMESPTFTSISSASPRTGFSGVSTAPTSVSAVSSVQQQLQSTIQTMEDKHSVQTEALLSALSDSQRQTKLLRTENNELRDRIAGLEGQIDGLTDQLMEARRQIQMYHQSNPLGSSIPRRTYDSRPRAGSVESRVVQPRVHPLSYSSTPYQSLPPERNMPSELYHPAHSNPSSSSNTSLGLGDQRKRMSSTNSSIFPVPPNNMSMLLLEDGDDLDHFALSSNRSHSILSLSPPSPAAIAIPAHNNNSRSGHGHTLNNSMSSAGNISPTTANFSMTETTGSPTSLHLRSEDEEHLGDLASLDIGWTSLA